MSDADAVMRAYAAARHPGGALSSTLLPPFNSSITLTRVVDLMELAEMSTGDRRFLFCGDIHVDKHLVEASECARRGQFLWDWIGATAAGSPKACLDVFLEAPPSHLARKYPHIGTSCAIRAAHTAATRTGGTLSLAQHASTALAALQNLRVHAVDVRPIASLRSAPLQALKSRLWNTVGVELGRAYRPSCAASKATQWNAAETYLCIKTIAPGWTPPPGALDADTDAMEACYQAVAHAHGAPLRELRELVDAALSSSVFTGHRTQFFNTLLRATVAETALGTSAGTVTMPIFMDAYALARMFRVYTPRMQLGHAPDKCTENMATRLCIVHAGAQHTGVYARFIALHPDLVRTITAYEPHLAFDDSLNCITLPRGGLIFAGGAPQPPLAPDAPLALERRALVHAGSVAYNAIMDRQEADAARAAALNAAQAEEIAARDALAARIVLLRDGAARSVIGDAYAVARRGALGVISSIASPLTRLPGAVLRGAAEVWRYAGEVLSPRHSAGSAYAGAPPGDGGTRPGARATIRARIVAPPTYSRDAISAVAFRTRSACAARASSADAPSR